MAIYAIYWASARSKNQQKRYVTTNIERKAANFDFNA